MSKNLDGIWENDVPGVNPGDECRYRIVTGGKEYLRIDPYARQVTNSVGNAIITDVYREDKSESFTHPALNAMIIYELHIRTFDKKGGKSGPGTLEGAINCLSYPREPGVNAVEVMPLAKFAGGYSWGYNPAHIFAVESDYSARGRSENS